MALARKVRADNAADARLRNREINRHRGALNRQAETQERAAVGSTRSPRTHAPGSTASPCRIRRRRTRLRSRVYTGPIGLADRGRFWPLIAALGITLVLVVAVAWAPATGSDISQE